MYFRCNLTNAPFDLQLQDEVQENFKGANSFILVCDVIVSYLHDTRRCLGLLWRRSCHDKHRFLRNAEQIRRRVRLGS